MFLSVNPSVTCHKVLNEVTGVKASGNDDGNDKNNRSSSNNKNIT